MVFGIEVTINSDASVYFGGQVNKNYEEIQQALALTKNDLIELAKNSLQYSFLDGKLKEKYLLELEGIS